MTPSVSSKGTPDTTPVSKGFAEALSGACTTACTNEGKPEQPDPLAALAAALLGLSPADRARLAALLLGQPEGTTEGSG